MNGPSFEWNEDSVTVFLKWTNFSTDPLASRKFLYEAINSEQSD